MTDLLKGVLDKDGIDRARVSALHGVGWFRRGVDCRGRRADFKVAGSDE